MNVERILQLPLALVAVLGGLLVILGALSGSGAITGLGLGAAVVGVVLYRMSDRVWDWYWDWLGRLQSGDVEPTASLQVFVVVLFVAVWTGGFVGLWWLADFGGVVTDEALVGGLISVVTVAGGVGPGIVLGGGLFAVFGVLRSRDPSLELTEGSRGFQLIVATVFCTLATYGLLLFLHPQTAVVFVVAYLVSFVAGASVYLTRAP